MTDTPTTSADLLCAAGKALYGEAWQSDMARLLGVSLRRIQYYAANDRQPPDSMLAELAERLAERSTACKDLSRTISRAIKPKP